MIPRSTNQATAVVDQERINEWVGARAAQEHTPKELIVLLNEKAAQRMMQCPLIYRPVDDEFYESMETVHAFNEINDLIIALGSD